MSRTSAHVLRQNKECVDHQAIHAPDAVACRGHGEGEMGSISISTVNAVVLEVFRQIRGRCRES